MTTTQDDDLHIVRNRTFDQIAIGDTASITRTLSMDDIALFAVMSGDDNPQHLDAEFAASSRYQGVIAHGMWGAALISAVLGTRLPGAGTVYTGQTLRFLQPVRVGDTLAISVTVTAREPRNRHVTLACRCVNQHGAVVLDGEAQVIAPAEQIERVRATLPEVRLHNGDGTRRLLEHARTLGPIKVAVINNSSLGMVRQWQTLIYDGRYSNTELNTGHESRRIPDFVKLAEAYGCVGLRCEREKDVEETIKKANSINDVPVLVDFVVSRDAMVWPMVAAGVSNDAIQYAQGITPTWDRED